MFVLSAVHFLGTPPVTLCVGTGMGEVGQQKASEL